MKTTLHLALAALLAAVWLPGVSFAENASDTTLSEDLDRNDPVLEPQMNPATNPGNEIVENDVTATEDAARQAEDDVEARVAGAEAEIKSLDESLKASQDANGDPNEAQESALRDFETAKDAAEERLNELEDADPDTVVDAGSRLDAAMTALRDAHQRAVTGLRQ